MLAHSPPGKTQGGPQLEEESTLVSSDRQRSIKAFVNGRGTLSVRLRD
jgi:hypothetical protein